MRSAPTTEMYTRCGAPGCDEAARTRFRVRSASPLLLPAQCTMAATPSTAGSIPSPVARSPVRNRMPSSASRPRRVSTRTSQPASRRRRTTCRPSVPVPPVTRMGDVIVICDLLNLSHRPGFVGHYYNDTTRRRNVTDGCTRRMAGGAFRGAPRPTEGGGLPDARLDERGRRRRAGDLAQARTLWRRWRREPGRVANDGRVKGVPEHAALAPLEARGVARGNPRRALERTRARP